jgi:hypothetical protein
VTACATSGLILAVSIRPTVLNSKKLSIRCLTGTSGQRSVMRICLTMRQVAERQMLRHSKPANGSREAGHFKS